MKFPDDEESNSEANFNFTVNPNLKSSDYVFFAFSHPYTYTDMLSSVQEVEQKCLQNENVHFEVSELT